MMVQKAAYEPTKKGQRRRPAPLKQEAEGKPPVEELKVGGVSLQGAGVDPAHRRQQHENIISRSSASFDNSAVQNSLKPLQLCEKEGDPADLNIQGKNKDTLQRETKEPQEEKRNKSSSK